MFLAADPEAQERDWAHESLYFMAVFVGLLGFHG